MTNHDTERVCPPSYPRANTSKHQRLTVPCSHKNGNSLNYNSASNTYVTAMIFSLAHPYGTPTILSSYSFSGTDDGSPNGGAGTCSGQGGANGWLCQHRWAAVAGMVGFHNTVGGAALGNWVSPQGSQIAFGRGMFALALDYERRLTMTFDAAADRCTRVCRDQQRRLRLDVELHHFAPRRVLLRRH